MDSLKSKQQKTDHRSPSHAELRRHALVDCLDALLFDGHQLPEPPDLLPVLSPMLAGQYHFNHTEIARILGAFQVSYAVTWLLGGIFLDAVGTRLGLALAVSFWSLVNMLTGVANSASGFTGFRFLLGIGEGLNWPGASKTVAEWFPSEERGLAVAIFDSGSSVGGALAARWFPGSPSPLAGAGRSYFQAPWDWFG